MALPQSILFINVVVGCFSISAHDFNSLTVLFCTQKKKKERKRERKDSLQPKHHVLVFVKCKLDVQGHNYASHYKSMIL